MKNTWGASDFSKRASGTLPPAREIGAGYSPRMPHPLSTSLRVRRTHDQALAPNADAKFVWACLPTGNVTLPPGEYAVIPLGLRLELDPGYTATIVSLAPAHDPGFLVVASNTEGDATVLVLNHTKKLTTITTGTLLGRIQVLGEARVSILEVP